MAFIGLQLLRYGSDAEYPHPSHFSWDISRPNQPIILARTQETSPHQQQTSDEGLRAAVRSHGCFWILPPMIVRHSSRRLSLLLPNVALPPALRSSRALRRPSLATLIASIFSSRETAQRTILIDTVPPRIVLEKVSLTVQVPQRTEVRRFSCLRFCCLFGV